VSFEPLGVRTSTSRAPRPAVKPLMFHGAHAHSALQIARCTGLGRDPICNALAVHALAAGRTAPESVATALGLKGDAAAYAVHAIAPALPALTTALATGIDNAHTFLRAERLREVVPQLTQGICHGRASRVSLSMSDWQPMQSGGRLLSITSTVRLQVLRGCRRARSISLCRRSPWLDHHHRLLASCSMLGKLRTSSPSQLPPSPLFSCRHHRSHLIA
jgi:hypothetical protein